MDNALDSQDIDAVCNEINMLLIAYWNYKNTISDFGTVVPNRERIMQLLFTIHVLENDLILRLCRLDEDDKSKQCFRQALKSVRDDVADDIGKKIDKRIKAFRKKINPLKTTARNSYIAHLAKKGAKEPIDPNGGQIGSSQNSFATLIQEAVEIVDDIAGQHMKYTLSVDSMQSPVDLRVLITD